MKNFLMLFLLLKPLYLAHTQLNKYDECLTWPVDHVRPTKHLDYFNVSVVLVEFNNFTELNVNCNRIVYDKVVRLRMKAYASSHLLLPTDFNINSLLYMFEFKYQTIVSIRNLKGFLMRKDLDYIENEIVYLQLYDLNFEFFLNETQPITRENCLRENFNDFDFLSSTWSLSMEKGTRYTRPVCPYIFYPSLMKQLVFNQIANSLIFRNKLSFIQLKEKENIDFDTNLNKLATLTLNVAYIDINEELVNKHVFRNIWELNLNGIVLSIEEELFKNLVGIKMISIQSDNFEIFLNKGLKWLNHINENVEVDLEGRKISG